MNSLTRLEQARRIIDSRPQLIRKARADQYTWEQIAQALGMSRAGVILLAKVGTDE